MALLFRTLDKYSFYPIDKTLPESRLQSWPQDIHIFAELNIDRQAI